MIKDEKAKAVEELAEALGRSKVAILADFRGMPTLSATQLRRQLRDAGVEYRVVKNTLAGFAADKANKAAIKPLLEGPTAMALGYTDELAPAKVLADFIKTSGVPLKIKGGMLGSRLLDAAQVAMLPSIPPRDVLISMLLGSMKSPITSVVATINAPLQAFAGVLQARARQMESSAEPQPGA